MDHLGSGVVNPLTQSDTDAIAKLSNIEVAISRNIRGVQIVFNKQSAVTYDFSIPDNQRKADDVYKFAELSTISGKLLGQGDRGMLSLGNNLIDGTKNGFGQRHQSRRCA